MFPLLLNPIPALLTFSAMFGVLIHDTRFEHVTALATMPAIVAGHAGVDAAIKQSDPHTHVERVSFARNLGSFKTAEPSTRPRDEDDNKYVIQKKPNANSYGNVYSWPSV